MSLVNAKFEEIKPQLTQTQNRVQAFESQQDNLTQDVLQLQQQGAELNTRISSLFQKLGRVHQQYLDQADKNRTIQTQVEDLKRAPVVPQTPAQWEKILQQQVQQEQKLIALQDKQARIQNTLHQLQQRHSTIQDQLKRPMPSQVAVLSTGSPLSAGSTSNAGRNRLEPSAPPVSLYEDEDKPALNATPNYLSLTIQNPLASSGRATAVPPPPTVKPASPTQLKTVTNGLGYVASGVGAVGSTLVNGVASGIGSAAHWLASTVNSAGQYAGLTRGAPVKQRKKRI